MQDQYTHRVHQEKISAHATLTVVEMPGAPSNIIAVLFLAGSRYDPPGMGGLAHLCEHLFMRRTRTYPNAFDRLRTLERAHVNFSAFTSREIALFIHSQIVQSTHNALDLLIDGMAHTVHRTDDVRREKNVVLQEIREHESDIHQYRFGLGMRALWNGSALARNIMGTPETLNNITLQDVTAYTQRYFAPQNARYLFVGGGYSDNVRAALHAYHETYESDEHVKPTQKNVSHKPVTPRVHIQTDQFGTDVVHVGVYIRTCSIHHEKDRVALALIRNHLADSWTSCLVTELRIMRDMAYWVSADTGYFSDTGYLEITYAVHPKHFAESVHIVTDNVYHIAERGLPEEDLTLQSDDLTAAIQQESMNVSSVFGWYVDDVAHGLPPESLWTFAEKVRMVTPEAIREVAQRYFLPDNIAVVSVGELPPDLRP